MDPHYLEEDIAIPKIQIDTYEDLEFIKQQLKTYAIQCFVTNKSLYVQQFRDQQSISNSSLESASSSSFSLKEKEEKENEKEYKGISDEKLEQLVLTHLDQFVEAMLEDACQNIEINGLPFNKNKSLEQDMDPIDQDLEKELETLKKEYTELAFSIMKKRTTFPKDFQSLTENLIQMETNCYPSFPLLESATTTTTTTGTINTDSTSTNSSSSSLSSSKLNSLQKRRTSSIR